MAVGLSVTAKSLLDQVGIEPQIALDIEGVDTLYAARPVFKTLEWDDANASWDNNLRWDGTINDPNSVDWISLAGTTTSISQQIRPDKGSTSSISTVNVAIVDIDGKVSKALSFDAITEILGKKATFSIGFYNESAVYPQDYQAIFRGVVVDFYTENGIVMVSLASSESLKRQVFLEKFQGETTALVNNSTTTIPVLDTVGIFGSADALTTYIRIDDEIMQVVSFTSTTIEVVRAQLNTVANEHEETEFETFYRLQGKPLDLARKIMLSDEGNNYFVSDDLPASINFVSITEEVANSIIFDYYNIQEKTGLVIGDSFKLDSGLNTGTYTIKEFGFLDSGDSYITANETLVTEVDYTGTLEYISQWNVLPTGLGMISNEVDVDEFNNIAAAFSSNFVEYDIYIKDSIDDAKTFLDADILFPQGLFAIPRKARSSVKFIVPPFSSDIVPTLDTNAILNITKIKQRRSVHKYLYNSYVWRFNQDSIEDKFLTGKVIINNDSIQRIQAGKKQLKMEAGGLRNNVATIAVIDNITQRMVDRYSLAPTYLEGIEVNFKTGYALEVGDIVPAMGADTKMINLQTGGVSKTQLYEVVNKSLNIKTGKIKLSLLSSSFEIQARYAVIGLASYTDLGSTDSRLVIKKVNDSTGLSFSSDQWRDFADNRIRVRSDDYTLDEIVIFKGVDPSNKNALLLDSPLSFTPTENMVVEFPDYEDSSAAIDSDYKLQFGFLTAQADIVNVISDSVFEVSDGSKLVVGSQIYVHSEDYTRTSFRDNREIIDITANTITLKSDLPFTPLVGDLIDGSNFLDLGFVYLTI